MQLRLVASAADSPMIDAVAPLAPAAVMTFCECFGI
jgi:hypothetical protein